MKPKPFSALNHFTVPLAMVLPNRDREVRTGAYLRGEVIALVLGTAGEAEHRSHVRSTTTLRAGRSTGQEALSRQIQEPEPGPRVRVSSLRCHPFARLGVRSRMRPCRLG